MARTIRWHIETDKHGSRVEGEIEVEDDATPQDVEHEVREAAFNHINWGYSEEENSESKPSA